jgi:hypothetical protein
MSELMERQRITDLLPEAKMKIKAHYQRVEDCRIERIDEKFMLSTDLRSSDGKKVWGFPGSLSDEQIASILEFANLAYRSGVINGSTISTEEVSDVLFPTAKENKDHV